MLDLILASQSPRRRMLLEEYGYSFSIEQPDDGAEGDAEPGESGIDLVARLATDKATNVAKRLGKGLILGCDTVAECDGQILGKPSDRADAKRILLTMSGRDHFVHSGVCLIDCSSGEQLVEVESTTLRMQQLSDEQLESYLDTDQWIGKAGAFGYQDGIDWVTVLHGSESNVVGLPMERLADMLKRFVQ